MIALLLLPTSNFGPDAIAERIGTGTASRIVGLCAHRLKVQGPDGRKTSPTSRPAQGRTFPPTEKDERP